MKVTAILKDFSDAFYLGFGESIPAFNSLSPEAKFAKLQSMKPRVTMKIQSGSFRDAVDLNILMKKPHSISYKLEPRKGYKLAIFEVTAI